MTGYDVSPVSTGMGESHPNVHLVSCQSGTRFRLYLSHLLSPCRNAHITDSIQGGWIRIGPFRKFRRPHVRFVVRSTKEFPQFQIAASKGPFNSFPFQSPGTRVRRPFSIGSAQESTNIGQSCSSGGTGIMQNRPGQIIGGIDRRPMFLTDHPIVQGRQRPGTFTSLSSTPVYSWDTPIMTFAPYKISLQCFDTKDGIVPHGTRISRFGRRRRRR